ncbi:MAG: hypothetical protein FWC50_04370 [Planctomycetaceae bacterium]|nr:hypothetical protein [Planctomycetaceae bacterium]
MFYNIPVSGKGIFSPMDEELFQDHIHSVFEVPVRIDFLMIHGNDSSSSFLLYHEKVFDVINNACGTMIGDYEEVCLEPDQLDMAIKALNRHKRHLLNGYVKSFVDKLIDLMTKAKSRNSPVYFVL